MEQTHFVKDLETVPEVAAELERCCRDAPAHTRAAVEERLKLRCYYGGKHVIATDSPRGLQVHAVGLTDPAEAHRLRVSLRAAGHRTVLSLYPRPWGDEGPDLGLGQWGDERRR
jgi:hypothetical protein